ncbi:uroporphyrinogen-III synthase [Macrococcus carouselicus]|nr:uroporphyrinogen-III synthase [Macrococcus carouselicus]
MQKEVDKMKPVVVMTDSEKTQTDDVEVVHIPLIGIEKLPVQSDYLHRHYDWLILTSKNAVEIFFDNYSDVTFDRLAVIGTKTRKSLEAKGLTADFMPSVFDQETFIAEAGSRFDGCSCCLPVSVKARPPLHRFLAARGQVDRIELYRPVASQSAALRIHDMIVDGEVDALTFMSPSAVDAYFKHYQPVVIPVVAIGPVTKAALDRYRQPCVMPETATKEQMIAKITEMREWNEF